MMVEKANPTSNHEISRLLIGRRGRERFARNAVGFAWSEVVREKR